MGVFSTKRAAEKVTRGMSVVRILSMAPLARELLKERGILFIGKHLSPLESLETVGKGNGLTGEEIDRLVEEMNKSLKGGSVQEGGVLTLTPEAAAELKRLLSLKRGKKGIRLRLASDGCAVYSYDLDFGTKCLGGELDLTVAGVRMFVEKKALPLLKGTQIDVQGGGFVFRNPNVKE